MLGFSRAAVFGSPQFEPGDEFFVEVSDDQLCHESLSRDSDDIGAI